MNIRSNLLRYFFVAVVTSLIPMSSYAADARFQKLPVSIPFKMHEQGARAEIEFLILKEGRYSYSLVFRHTDRNGREVRELLENSKDARPNHGEPIYVAIEVYEFKDGTFSPFTHWSVTSLPLTSWGSGYFNKPIHSEFLSPGKYKVVATATQKNPKFETVDVEFKIGFARQPK